MSTQCMRSSWRLVRGGKRQELWAPPWWLTWVGIATNLLRELIERSLTGIWIHSSWLSPRWTHTPSQTDRKTGRNKLIWLSRGSNKVGKAGSGRETNWWNEAELRQEKRVKKKQVKKKKEEEEDRCWRWRLISRSKNYILCSCSIFTTSDHKPFHVCCTT